MLVLAEARQRAEQRAERVDPVVGLQGVVVAGGEAQLAPRRRRPGGKRRHGGSGGRLRPGPGRLDRPLDESRRHAGGHPQADGEPVGPGGDLEAEVGLAGRGAPPRRAQEGDQVGPQHGRPSGPTSGGASTATWRASEAMAAVARRRKTTTATTARTSAPTSGGPRWVPRTARRWPISWSRWLVVAPGWVR